MPRKATGAESLMAAVVSRLEGDPLQFISSVAEELGEVTGWTFANVVSGRLSSSSDARSFPRRPSRSYA